MRRLLTVRYVVSWILCVLLSALFLIVGIPKILGGQNHWVRAFEMFGYPLWFRIVVGTAETVCAIFLLVPPVTVLAAGGLTLLMVGAMYSQIVVGRPASALPPALIFLALLFLAWLRRGPRVAAEEPHPLSPAVRRILHEGVVAGIIGATSVAVWFLIVDTIARHPLFTPTVLGNALFRVLGPVPAGEGPLLHIIAYTIFHYAAFIAGGLVVALVVKVAERQPPILLGFFILFIAFEIGFHGAVAILQETTVLRALAWYQIMIGNLIAAAMMGGYIWRLHPELGPEFAHALDLDARE